MTGKRILSTLAVFLFAGLTAPAAWSATCKKLVQAGCPAPAITNTYTITSQAGPKLCLTRSTSNVFGTCSTDADCGSLSNSTGIGDCLATPWLTVGSVPSGPWAPTVAT